MKREQLYHNTVDILVQAYFNNTLEYGDPCGCAVGNIIYANCSGLTPSVNKWDNTERFKADWWFGSLRPDIGQKEYESYSEEEGLRQIASTGYSVTEISEIESAFEHVEHTKEMLENDDDVWMFNGLMAVVECLDRIHENTDEQVSTQTKHKFKKQLA